MIEVSIGDGVATLTLCRPPVNAISEEWLRRFETILGEIGARADWTVLHVVSDQKVFCAGADLEEMRGRMGAPDGGERTYAFVAAIQRLYGRIEQLPRVSLAEIGGAALGGGLELALACDLRIAALEARLGLPEAQLGLIPGAGGTQRLTRLCGRPLAARLILGAETLDGAEARALGLVQWAAPRAELRARALEIARRVAELPAGALAASKACIAAAAEPGRGGYSDELEATRRLMGEPKTRTLVQRFFEARASQRPERIERGAKP
jgi:enoyl-CoA hydratase/carnithine racemase